MRVARSHLATGRRRLFNQGVFLGKIVVDSGQPVDPEVIEKMFQPFFTSKLGGMGIGLSICKTVVDAHGGQLTAAAKKPRGMEFKITLPLDRQT
jgi:two-component system, LuxR family, sensor kinase FixL